MNKSKLFSMKQFWKSSLFLLPFTVSSEMNPTKRKPASITCTQHKARWRVVLILSSAQTHIHRCHHLKQKFYLFAQMAVHLIHLGIGMSRYRKVALPPESLQQRLQIVFGRTNAVREAIDNALERDNGFRRRTNMRYLEAPNRFPTPDTMHNYEPVDWIAWIQQETQSLIEGINEEIKLLNEEDDLFSGKTCNTQTSTQNHKETGEIPPVDKLAMPLIPVKVNNPLPQRTKSQNKQGTNEIPPGNIQNFTQGKPPVPNTKPAK